MTITKTPRLGLTLESDDELIDPFAINWPILDSFAGSKTVSNGSTPPDSQLYDGMIVSESSSGKVWIARRNSLTGVFTKSWLIYPWIIESYNSTYTNVLTSPGTGRYHLPVDTINNPGSMNASSADIVAGHIVTPVDGLYEITYDAQWNNANNAGQKSVFVSINDIEEYSTSETLRSSTDGNSSNVGSLHVKLLTGDKVDLIAWQSSGVTQGCKAQITMMLVSTL